MNKYFLLFLISFLLHSCKEESKATTVNIPQPAKGEYGTKAPKLSQDEYYDKVLGALVGSAIGDAMGASTEMWHREDIQKKYGYITGLTPAVRPQSPEGTWNHNLSSGATTDDTRWKLLTTKYFSSYGQETGPEHFADFIIDYYQSLTKDLVAKENLTNTDALDHQIEKIDWVKEWARVALGYKKGSTEYLQSMNRFYGGEMSCAGMLYSPMFGLTTKNPTEAYKKAYNHSLFDIGYAKDISSLVAAMTNTAMQTKDMDSILNTSVFVDPHNYQDSRLVGRISLDLATKGENAVLDAQKLIENPNSTIQIPKGFPGSKFYWRQQNYVYDALEADQKAIPFHAGEIWQILFTGLKFGEGDFVKTLQFIVNYGRDNDTVAAVAGMILGARNGYSQLPKDLKEQVLQVNKEVMGIDLEAMAEEIIASTK
ncbi:hypothetical protein GGR42_002337 [Saonia flava]|uniref:ADP-ribosylglycohydrolase n=1 Tax=Saonia flava TaxID=523696 RepID=A0A846R1R3_9FLAO|nr:ADP-ribosylglycohydrolase family protein [Saonia flava]NJB71875.1 hypothetical protein [Saonia flava]